MSISISPAQKAFYRDNGYLVLPPTPLNWSRCARLATISFPVAQAERTATNMISPALKNQLTQPRNPFRSFCTLPATRRN